MGLDAVKVHVADADFYLVPEDPSPAGARALAQRLGDLRDTDATLRLRPRTAPARAPWVDGRLDEEFGLTDDSGLTGREDPGTSWRDVLGSAVGTAEAVSLDEPVALWHWAIEREPESGGASGYDVN